jgi:hypothetical protein
MLDVSEFECFPPKKPLLISIAGRPEEIELALASNGGSLRQRLLLALVAELTTIEMVGAAGSFPVTQAARRRNTPR